MIVYEPLAQWLRAQTATRVSATFPEVENIIGFRLPISARTCALSWANDPKQLAGARLGLRLVTARKKSI